MLRFCNAILHRHSAAHTLKDSQQRYASSVPSHTGRSQHISRRKIYLSRNPIIFGSKISILPQQFYGAIACYTITHRVPRAKAIQERRPPTLIYAFMPQSASAPPADQWNCQHSHTKRNRPWGDRLSCRKHTFLAQKIPELLQQQFEFVSWPKHAAHWIVVHEAQIEDVRVFSKRALQPD